MQTYKFKSNYDAIFLTWVVGYLDDAQLEEFLKKAAGYLNFNSNRESRKDEPESFINVLDSVIDKTEKSVRWKGQRIRTKGALERIFGNAGLIVHQESDIT